MALLFYVVQTHLHNLAEIARAQLVSRRIMNLEIKLFKKSTTGDQ